MFDQQVKRAVRPIGASRTLRMLVAFVVATLPCLHALLHSAHPAHASSESHGPLLESKAPTDSQDHDVDCPICASRVDDSATPVHVVVLVAHKATGLMLSSAPVAIPLTQQPVCAIPRAPPGNCAIAA